MSLDADLAALARARDATLPLFATTGAALERRYAPGKWTLRQFLLHLADCEGVLLDRLRRLLAEQRPLLLAFDENAWAERLFPAGRDLALAGRSFAAARDSAIELARLCPRELHGRIGTHSERGERTFASVVRFIHQHNDHHLDQARALIDGRPWVARVDDPLAPHYATPPDSKLAPEPRR